MTTSLAQFFRLTILGFLFITNTAYSSDKKSSEIKPGPPEGTVIQHHVQIAVRDGVRLNTMVVLPPGASGHENSQKVPTILIRTPYKTEIGWKSPLHNQLIKEGYAIAMQHERGRYFSEGAFRMLGGAVNDGWDTMDWITAQSWSNGKIGTYGCSSSAENQLKLGSKGHPAHRAMVAGSSGVGVSEAGPFTERGNFWRGGVWQQGWMNYFHASMHQHWPQLPKTLTDEERQRALGFFELTNTGWQTPSSTYNKVRMHLPMIEIMDELGAPKNEIKQYLSTDINDAVWSENRITEGEMISIPALWFESLYDISARSTLAYFEWNREQNAAKGRDNQRMRLTQGGHCSFGRSSVESEDAKIGDLALGDMRYDYVTQVVDWFNHWMKSEPARAIPDTAYVAFAGYGEWLRADTLPMQGNYTLYLTESGKLTQKQPTSAASLSFVYDPDNPVPSLGGEIYGEGDDHFDGSFDQSELHKRKDVVVFTSDALTQDVTLFGMAELHLSVSSDQPDTDFTIKINDVYPDGRAFNLGNTIQRMRYRNGFEQEQFMHKGETYQIGLPPIPLSRIIKTGHRIQVEVSSSNFPSYSRNLNTDKNPYLSTDRAKATNTIRFGDQQQSWISLPVVKD